MKWDECFPEICKSLYRVSVTSSSGTNVGTGFVVANYKKKDKLDFVLATARHLIDNLPEWETIYWKLEQFDWQGNLQKQIIFKTNVEATGKSAVTVNKEFDVGTIFVPNLNNGENNRLRLIDPRCAIIPGGKVGWAGFPLFTVSKTLSSHPCYFEGVVSTVVNKDGKLFYLVDGHGGQGVSGGPLWCWNDEKDNYEIIGICSQYLFPEVQNLPGVVVFESVNYVTHYLQTSSELDIDVVI
jgi:hypothetical protein